MSFLTVLLNDADRIASMTDEWMETISRLHFKRLAANHLNHGTALNMLRTL